MYVPETIPFSTRLHSLPKIDVLFPRNPDLQASKLKKLARQSIALEHSTDQLGFLHSVMLQVNNRTFLLAGSSGIGKSSYASLSSERTHAKVLANDWIGIEREDNKFYVSDVNYPDELKHANRVPLSGIIFLTKQDQYERDVFVPNDPEYQQLLTETFDTATPEELEKLTVFWKANKKLLPFYCAIQARNHDQGYIEDTLLQVIDHSTPKKSTSVGVIGTGNLGSQIAYQLGQLPFVQNVHLYNRSLYKAQAYAADMNQSDVTDPEKFVAHDDPADVFAKSDSIFMVFRDESKQRQDLPERWRKLPAHLSIVNEYAQIISDTQFSGTVFMMSNPVDILTYALYSRSQQYAHSLRTHQVYGLGLELDLARTVYLADSMGHHVSPDELKVYGNHADKIAIEGPFSDKEHDDLVGRVGNASADIRRYLPRTIFGPTGAAIRSFRGFMLDDQSTRVAVIQNGAFIGHRLQFEHKLPLFPDDIDREKYDEILEENKKVVAGLKDLL